METVKIKGGREGLLVMLPADKPWNEVVGELGDRLDESKDFWTGAAVQVDVGESLLEEGQIQRLQELLNKRYQLNLTTLLSRSLDSRQAAEAVGLTALEPPSHPEVQEVSLVSIADAKARQEPVSNALYWHHTVRSGQVLKHDGHVVIMGDVNPGAEVIASGDIVIWGTLRGIAHAGARGDESAQIMALHLRPTQLRISGNIARSPDDYPTSHQPESARIENGEIRISVAKGWKA